MASFSLMHSPAHRTPSCAPVTHGGSEANTRGRGPGELTFPLHAHDQALLIAAVLAAVALALVNEAVLVIPTCVDEIFPYGPLEEPFAAFAAVHPIVLSWSQERNGPQVCPWVVLDVSSQRTSWLSPK